jgi:putative transposase
MIVQKAIKVRLYPTLDQQIQFHKTFGHCRFLYNRMLRERIDTYSEFKDNKEDLYSHKYKTEKQYKHDFPFLKDVDSIALQNARERLQDAYQRFFDGLKVKRFVGFPKFKSRKNKQSYRTKNINNNIKIDFDKKLLKLPKIKTWISFRDDRVFSDKIRNVTISKTKSGKYYASIGIKTDIDTSVKNTIHLKNIQAFDMSAKSFLISDSVQYVNPRFYRNELKKLQRKHRQFSRKKKGSKNRHKARLQLSRHYDKITNRKKDWMHKITHNLSEKYDVIILEDLNVEGMKRFNKGVSKSVTLDFSWYQFVSTLKYKMERKGKHLILVDRWFPSSKLCNKCGYKNNELKLSDREWVCPECETHHDRDKNASQNLLKEGLNILQSRKINVILPMEHRKVTPLEIV